MANLFIYFIQENEEIDSEEKLEKVIQTGGFGVDLRRRPEAAVNQDDTGTLVRSAVWSKDDFLPEFLRWLLIFVTFRCSFPNLHGVYVTCIVLWRFEFRMLSGQLILPSNFFLQNFNSDQLLLTIIILSLIVLFCLFVVCLRRVCRCFSYCTSVNDFIRDHKRSVDWLIDWLVFFWLTISLEFLL